MEKAKLKELGLSDEMAAKVADESKKEFAGYISRDRFNEVNEAKKALEVEVAERDKQLAELKKSAAASDELKAKIAELEKSNTDAKADYEAKIKAMRIDTAVEKALTGAKARNLKAARAMLDLSNAELDDDGEIKGLSKQIKKLTESDDTKFLFDIPKDDANDEATKPAINNIAGMAPISPNGTKSGEAVSIGAQYARSYSAQFAPNSQAAASSQQ